MGRKISFSIARLDKVAFITSPYLWPKVLRALIFSLEVFFSWSSLPHHHPSKKGREEAGGEGKKRENHKSVRARAESRQWRAEPLRQQSAVPLRSSGWPCRAALHVSCCPRRTAPQYCLHGTGGIGPYVRRPARGHVICDRHLCPACSGQQPSAAEHPRRCPRSPPSPEICRKQSVVPGLLQVCRFSIKLQLL